MSSTAVEPTTVEAPPARHLRSVASDGAPRPQQVRPNVRPAAVRRPGGLTRRGRVVLVVLGGLVLACMFVLGRSTSSSAAESGPAPTAVVGPGMTLWSIAQQVAPQKDPRQTIAALTALNHISAATPLVPGQVLTLPRH